MPKRNDAAPAEHIKPHNAIMPYLMRKRSDSLVYHRFSLDITPSIHFIEQKNAEAEEKKYRIFDIIMAAIVRTAALRPQLNKFICRQRIWQRNDLCFNFVVKTDHSEHASQRNAFVTFEADMAFEEIAAVMRHSINAVRYDTETEDEIIIRRIMKLPGLLRKFAGFLLHQLDLYGKYPGKLRTADGMHATAGIANLGSIGLQDPSFHHLYEWGTTSMFITFGSLKRQRLPQNHQSHQNLQSSQNLQSPQSADFTFTMDFGVTLDERIADGYYFMKSLRVFEQILQKPAVLEKRLETGRQDQL